MNKDTPIKMILNDIIILDNDFSYPQLEASAALAKAIKAVESQNDKFYEFNYRNGDLEIKQK